ncbi:MAG: VWA domain-containing protein, partial [Nocardioides sp.]
RPVRVVLVADVSRSMREYATAYLHLMRAFAQTGRAETFAFATGLTRLTATLAHRSAERAVARATEEVVDRYGGTHLARCLAELSRGRHGNLLRGAVLVIASDGWDSDPPDELSEVMVRLRRRVRRVVWLNPRLAAPGYRPMVGPMAAALPHCDAFLPGNTVASLPEVFEAIAAR